MDMDKLVALCRRRGFLFQSSEIYGGLNGFWDYGPLGVELKRNIKEAWWRDMVTGHDELTKSPGAPSTHEMVGLDCSIIMHPQVWNARGLPLRLHGRLPHRSRATVTTSRGPLATTGKRVFVASDGDSGRRTETAQSDEVLPLRGKRMKAWPGKGPVFCSVRTFRRHWGRRKPAP
jgi:hypothetical protein